MGPLLGMVRPGDCRKLSALLLNCEELKLTGAKHPEEEYIQRGGKFTGKREDIHPGGSEFYILSIVKMLF